MQRLLHLWFALLYTALIAVAGCTPPPSMVAPTPVNAAEPSVVPDDMLAAVRERGVLRIATDANYPPQSFLKLDGTWEGFDVEVGREVARRLGVRSEFVDVSFDTLTAGGWDDRWDINVGSMTITPERKKVLLFTAPYYYTPAVFVVHASSTITTVSRLRGTVGVGVATTYLDYLNHRLALDNGRIDVAPPEVTPRVYEIESLALQDLAQGDGVQLTAVLAALPTIRAAIDRGEPLRVLDPPVFYESLALALDRNSSRDPVPLADAINSVIADMRNDGTLTRLSKRFYGVDISTK